MAITIKTYACVGLIIFFASPFAGAMKMAEKHVEAGCVRVRQSREKYILEIDRLLKITTLSENSKAWLLSQQAYLNDMARKSQSDPQKINPLKRFFKNSPSSETARRYLQSKKDDLQTFVELERVERGLKDVTVSEDVRELLLIQQETLHRLILAKMENEVLFVYEYRFEEASHAMKLFDDVLKDSTLPTELRDWALMSQEKLTERTLALHKKLEEFLAREKISPLIWKQVRSHNDEEGENSHEAIDDYLDKDTDELGCSIQ
ncbi:hypothetical protein H0X06_04465 [Candidatus Dependentiae bacterium]|nr:hypothetical protein [Candidatus Dependentiae bacterium]